MSAKLRVTGIVASLAALTMLILLVARPGLDPARINPLVLLFGAWVAFGCAAWLLRKVTVPLAVGLILAGGIAVQVVALSGPPHNSSDLYRYIWDGRVQAAGIDPYLYAPADQGVVALRNDFLWPSAGPGTALGRYGGCITQNRRNAVDPAYSLVVGCTKLNRPGVPTVYPPVAEAYFFAVQLAAPADDSATPIQAAAAAFATLTTVILLFGLRGLGKDPRLAALWAWCPTVALEAGQNGHVDVVAVTLTLVALLLLARARTEGRTVLGGVLLGLAIATKVTPVLVVPAVLRRGWLLISASAVAAISLVYAPHVMAVGRKILGFLPGYLKQEGYSSGNGFSVIGFFVHGKLATAAAVVILGVIAMAIIRFGDPGQPWRGGVLMTAAALVVCTPRYQWYAIMLVMLVALDGRPEWLAIAAGGYLSSHIHLRIDGITIYDPRLLGYGGGAAIVGVCAVVRYLLTHGAGTGVGVGEPATAADAMTTDAVSASAAAIASDLPASGDADGAVDAKGAGSAHDATEHVVEPAAVAGFLPRAYRERDSGTRPPPATVNWSMSYQDPPRRRRTSRYPAFTQYEDGYSSYQDTQADYGSGGGHRDGYRGFEGLAGPPRELAPWDDPAQESAWDTGTQRSVRDSGALQAAWGKPAEWEQARRRSAAFGALSDDHGRLPGTGYGEPRRGRGLLAGAVAGFLAAAVALGVANLIAAFVRPQASPIIAVGEAFIDRTPPALKNYAVQKFGENDKNMLLLGMYVTIALLAIVIGMLAWRRVSIGVAGIGLFGLFGAFVAITRPESRVSDMVPSIVGGIAGIAALIWLVRMGASGYPGHLGHRGHRRRRGPSTALDGSG